MGRLRLYLILLLLWGGLGVYAETLPNCGVLVSIAQEAGYRWLIYKSVENRYVLVEDESVFLSNEEMVFPFADFRWSNANSGKIDLAVQRFPSERDSYSLDDFPQLDLYRVTLVGFEQLTTTPEQRFALHNKPWSYDGRFVALDKLYNLSEILEDLWVYDVAQNKLYHPTDLNRIFAVTWSPTQNIMAFVGSEFMYIGGNHWGEIQKYALYVTHYDGTPIITIPADENTLELHQWISDSELGVTTCQEAICQLTIYDVFAGTSISWQMGSYFLEGYIASIDQFLLSGRYPLEGMFLMRHNGTITPLSVVDIVVSLPTLSPDQRYLAYYALVDEQMRLYWHDLLGAAAPHYMTLADVPPERIGNRYESIAYGLYDQYKLWHPEVNTLLYDDQNTLYSFDPVTGVSTPLIENLAGRIVEYQWLCSA